MTVFTSAGTTLAIASAAPTTYNEAGYEALTWTSIGEVSDLGDIPNSRTYETVSWRNIANRGESKAKGGFSLPEQTITVGLDPDDAGQILLTTASESDAPYSIKISNPNLGDWYGRALVMGGPTSMGDVNAIVTRQVTLAYTIVSQSEDGLVFVAPA
jgi:hypothetical protein